MTAPLETSVAAQTPLEVERLVPAHARRITVADHERWMQTGQPPHADDADITDLLEELRRVESEASR